MAWGQGRCRRPAPARCLEGEWPDSLKRQGLGLALRLLGQRHLHKCSSRLSREVHPPPRVHMLQDSKASRGFSEKACSGTMKATLGHRHVVRRHASRMCYHAGRGKHRLNNPGGGPCLCASLCSPALSSHALSSHWTQCNVSQGPNCCTTGSRTGTSTERDLLHQAQG